MHLKEGEELMQTKIKLGKSKSISFLKLPFDFFENQVKKQEKLSPKDLEKTKERMFK